MTDHKSVTIGWVPVKTECCPDCHGKGGYIDDDRRMVCVSCMGYGYLVFYEQQIIYREVI